MKLLRQYDQEKERFESLLREVEQQMRSYEPINDGSSIEDPDNNNNNEQNNDPQVIRTQTQSLKEIGLQVLDKHIDELEDRNKKVEKIASDVKDLHEAFQDLNQLVDEQQEDINAIESNVTQAKENVQTGTANLEVAKNYQDAYRRKQCYVFLCVLVILGIIVAGVCGSGQCSK